MTNLCLKQLEEKKRGLQEHLIGLKLSMEDQKSVCVEVEAKITIIKATHQSFVIHQVINVRDHALSLFTKSNVFEIYVHQILVENYLTRIIMQTSMKS